MALYARRRIALTISQKKSGLDVLFKRGETDVLFDALEDLSKCCMWKLKIPIPTEDLDVMDGDELEKGHILFLETDTRVKVKLSKKKDTGIKVEPVMADTGALGAKPGALYLEGSFSHLYITANGESGEANLIVGVVGS